MTSTVTLTMPPRTAAEPVTVVWYTDPISVWCWGCEPALRRIEALYGDQVTTDVRMGGLFEDFTPMRDSWSRMSGGRWRDMVLTFLTAVAGQHRMPMNVEGMADAMEDFRSTWPACVAAKAAEAQGADAGRRYLRRLREASLVEGRGIHRRSVQLAVAVEAGLDAARFANALDDGSADRAFHEDLEECRRQGVTSFPSFDLRRGLASLRVEGYQPWEAFEHTFREVAPDLDPRSMEMTEAAVLDQFRRHGRCATLEIAAVFGASDDDAEILLEDLEADGKVQRRTFGSAYLWDAARPQ